MILDKIKYSLITLGVLVASCHLYVDYTVYRLVFQQGQTVYYQDHTMKLMTQELNLLIERIPK